MDPRRQLPTSKVFGQYLVPNPAAGPEKQNRDEEHTRAQKRGRTRAVI